MAKGRKKHRHVASMRFSREHKQMIEQRALSLNVHQSEFIRAAVFNGMPLAKAEFSKWGALEFSHILYGHDECFPVEFLKSDIRTIFEAANEANLPLYKFMSAAVVAGADQATAELRDLGVDNTKYKISTTSKFFVSTREMKLYFQPLEAIRIRKYKEAAQVTASTFIRKATAFGMSKAYDEYQKWLRFKAQSISGRLLYKSDRFDVAFRNDDLNMMAEQATDLNMPVTKFITSSTKAGIPIAADVLIKEFAEDRIERLHRNGSQPINSVYYDGVSA